MIELDRLTRDFARKDGQTVRAVDAVSLTVPEGEICVFLGPSGCGKTTTLKMINRLIEPTSGRVLIGGEDTTTLDEVDLRRHIGYVIQQVGLFPNMTIEENVTAVPRLLGWNRKRCRERAAELMSMVALDPKLYSKRYPRELSGGQQQRIGVIRALAADPPVLLMDEPFGAVDPINREAIQNEFLHMQRQLKKTVIMVSHDIDEAIKLGDRIAVFRRGRLVQYDRPDTLLAHPRDEFVSQFIGQDSTLKRLLLVTAGDAATRPPFAAPGTTLAEAFDVMDQQDCRALTVVDAGRRVLGYVTRRAARSSTGLCGEHLTDFAATVHVGDNLRVVLSKMYQFGTSWMPVLDADGGYVGEITQDSIAAWLGSARTPGQADDAAPAAFVAPPGDAGTQTTNGR
ncbi:glycine/betaine ABC transporter ATP-binding protein [Burkholderia sp. WAC0059]|uniref:ABC transporter ATP-binding protein n=1 Tax=Burkholderia sp. WAC0059 TaxID=2066022 RepID=UPI000C7F349B|nr:ABC transporter ATP-binding protein [Burkholderia sp. WAC0059]PLZ02787.1 glycine/betaine ABC transporter ATP-binding protein [Burkholderia sp. WAC0059]